MSESRKDLRLQLGFTLIELMIVIAIIGILVGAAVVGWGVAIRSGNEAATLQNLRTIAASELQYYNSHGRTFGSFEQLIQEKMLTSKFAGNPPIADGYVLTLKVVPKTETSSTFCTLNADPQDARSGTTHFYVDSTDSSIHINRQQPAGPNDPVQ